MYILRRMLLWRLRNAGRLDSPNAPWERLLSALWWGLWRPFEQGFRAPRCRPTATLCRITSSRDLHQQCAFPSFPVGCTDVSGFRGEYGGALGRRRPCHRRRGSPESKHGPRSLKSYFQSAIQIEGSALSSSAGHQHSPFGQRTILSLCTLSTAILGPTWIRLSPPPSPPSCRRIS